MRGEVDGERAGSGGGAEGAAGGTVGGGGAAPGIAAPGFRLSAGTRPGRVRLQVSDLERSFRWYREVLGLALLDEGEGRAALGAPGGVEPLIELLERPGARPVPPRGHLGLFHLAILLPARHHLGRFAAHLVEREERVGASDHLVSEAFYLHDPDGLGIEVYADRPRSAWRARGREIIMATQPLDLDALLRSGEGGRWAGAPEGTVVGHLHLRVGGLDGAEAFYHRALGLDKVVWSYPGALFMSAGGYHHHLGVNRWAGPVPPAAEDEARLLEWELVAPASDLDLDQLATSLEQAGAPVETGGPGGNGPGEGGLAGEPAAADPHLLTRDPWGTALRVRVTG